MDREPDRWKVLNKDSLMTSPLSVSVDCGKDAWGYSQAKMSDGISHDQATGLSKCVKVYPAFITFMQVLIYNHAILN